MKMGWVEKGDPELGINGWEVGKDQREGRNCGIIHRKSLKHVEARELRL